MTSLWIYANVVAPLMVLGLAGLGVWWARRETAKFDRKHAQSADPAELPMTHAAVHHRGLAAALGVSEAHLEDMTVRELAALAHHRGGRLDFGAHSGLGLGLTLSAKGAEPVANQAG
jgi:hypothetical protein